VSMMYMVASSHPSSPSPSFCAEHKVCGFDKATFSSSDAVSPSDIRTVQKQNAKHGQRGAALRPWPGWSRAMPCWSSCGILTLLPWRQTSLRSSGGRRQRELLSSMRHSWPCLECPSANSLIWKSYAPMLPRLDVGLSSSTLVSGYVVAFLSPPSLLLYHTDGANSSHHTRAHERLRGRSLPSQRCRHVLTFHPTARSAVSRMDISSDSTVDFLLLFTLHNLSIPYAADCSAFTSRAASLSARIESSSL
jgi:hypothetical protein